MFNKTIRSVRKVLHTTTPPGARMSWVICRFRPEIGVDGLVRWSKCHQSRFYDLNLPDDHNEYVAEFVGDGSPFLAGIRDGDAVCARAAALLLGVDSTIALEVLAAVLRRELAELEGTDWVVPLREDQERDSKPR